MPTPLYRNQYNQRMILDSFYIKNENTSKEVAASNRIGATSRRELVSSMAKIHESLTRALLGKYLKGKKDIQALHMGCGSGEDSFLIASLLTGQSRLTAFEADPIMIQNAQSANYKPFATGLHFVPFCLKHWNESGGQRFDFIYARFWIGAFVEIQDLLKSIRQRLNHGGFLIVELMRFSGYTAFPYHHAFARVSELITQMENGQQEAIDNCLNLLKSIGFTNLVVEYASPGFVTGKYKSIVSRVLELMVPLMLRRGKVVQPELEALLLELKAYEEQDYTLIARPGVCQVIAGYQ